MTPGRQRWHPGGFRDSVRAISDSQRTDSGTVLAPLLQAFTTDVPHDSRRQHGREPPDGDARPSAHRSQSPALGLRLASPAATALALRTGRAGALRRGTVL